VKAVDVGAMSRDDFDESIKGAVESGMLTTAEADAAAAKLGPG
jgi:hypothetical protein